MLIRDFLPGWLFCGLLLGSISSLPGNARDIYWVLLLKNFDKNWVVFDHGKCADVFSLEE